MKKKLFMSALAFLLVISLFVPSLRPVSAEGPYRPLVGMWRFDGNAGDSSGYGNTGSVNATFVPGIFNQALSFSGTGSFVSVRDNPSLDATESLTIEAWVKFDSFVAPSTRIVSKTAPLTLPEERSYVLYVLGPGPALGKVGFQLWKNASTTSVLNGATPLATGQWYHIAATYQFLADGSSVMKIFVNGVLDGTMSNAVGPIRSSSANLSIGRDSMAVIDEVHIWNTPHPVYSVFVTLGVDTNPVGTQHTFTATVRANTGDASVPKPFVPGVRVDAVFTDTSVNHPVISPVSTNATGEAQLSYTDTSAEGGIDMIGVWADQDWNGVFDPSLDAFAITRKNWVENFVTGGGKINEENGKKAAWSFAGTVGVLPEGGIEGNFTLVNHMTGVTYYSNNFTSMFFAGDNATSPDARNNTVGFTGNFTSSAGGSVLLNIIIQDLGEPGAKVDTIVVVDRTGLSPSPPTWPPTPNPPGTPWIGSLNSTPPPPYTPVPIDGGNIQVHNVE